MKEKEKIWAWGEVREERWSEEKRHENKNLEKIHTIILYEHKKGAIELLKYDSREIKKGSQNCNDLNNNNKHINVSVYYLDGENVLIIL